MPGDWHGIGRTYLRDDGASASRLRPLLTGATPPRWSAAGIRAAWGDDAAPSLTIAEGIRRGPCLPVTHAPASFGDWVAMLEQIVDELARTIDAPVLALGGGVDAAAVLLAWHRTGHPLPAIVTLATGIPGYDEVGEACDIAARLGAPCRVVEVAASQLVARIPDAVAAIETPLYDLHPIHRRLLAEAVGPAATLVTGDGADAVFAHRADLDYVPLVVALARSVGVETRSPFFDDRPKTPRRVPALDLTGVLRPDAIEALSCRLGLAADLSLHADRVRWATLDHVVRHLEAH